MVTEQNFMKMVPKNVAGNWTGEGTKYREDGSIIYKGTYKEGKPEGQGISYFKNGSIRYEGGWKENKYEGQ